MVSRALSWKPLVYLGTISFPIYILHGPIGQVFYKRCRRGETLRTVFKVPSVFPGLSSHRARLRRGRARDLHQE